MAILTGLTKLSDHQLRIAAVGGAGFDEVVFVESLAETDFATQTLWTPTGQFADANPYTLIFNAGAIGGTMTQANGDLISACLNDKEYVFTYTIGVSTAPDGDFALVLSAGIPSADVPLPFTAGTHGVYFKSGSAASAADFVITATETTATEGSITFDDFSLTRLCDKGVSADAVPYWSRIKPVEGDATVSASSLVGDDLSSVTLLEADGINGVFSRILVTAGNIVAYRGR